MSPTPPIEYYTTRSQVQQQALRELKAKVNRVSQIRKFTFATWAVLFLLGALNYLSMELAWGIAGVIFVGFVILLAKHELLERQIRVHKELLDIAQTQLARLHRRWTEMPPQEAIVPEEAVGVSDDLDLFGHASLFHLLCRAHTPQGRGRLRDWLLFAATPEVVAARREALHILAPITDYREELDLRGRLLASSAAGPESFVQWAEDKAWLPRHPWLLPTARVAVVLFLLAIGLSVLGILSAPIAVVVCLTVVCLNLILSVLLVGTVHDIFEKVDSRHRDIQQYRMLFDMVARLPQGSALLDELRDQVHSGPSGASSAIVKLAKIMRWAQMRHSSAVGIIHLFLQLLFLVDFHILSVLERWQNQHGIHVRQWFDALAELETLASLASLCYDQPDWTFPALDRQVETYSAHQLGHPLLPAPVRNDVTLGPKGRFLLVSGSNMSGKSTLMRAIGLNAILAQAGAPVCATKLSLPPVEIATSMRIQDSLEDGISFFMAELQRLKSVVDQGIDLATNSQRTLLFLLDEILQGTNSAERHIAVQRVVHRLTECGGMGAISTHDLELANSDDLAKICDAVHFRESFAANGTMTFDYVMRPGVATSTNALKLLEMVGID